MASMVSEFPLDSDSDTSKLIYSHTDTRAKILIDLETRVISVRPDIVVLQNAKVFHAVKFLFDVVGKYVPGYFGGNVNEAVLYMLVAQASAVRQRDEVAESLNALFLARYDELERKLIQVKELQDELNATIIQYRVAIGFERRDDINSAYSSDNNGEEEDDDSMAFDSQ
jgi:hypothetical protein